MHTAAEGEQASRACSVSSTRLFPFFYHIVVLLADKILGLIIFHPVYRPQFMLAPPTSVSLQRLSYVLSISRQGGNVSRTELASKRILYFIAKARADKMAAGPRKRKETFAVMSMAKLQQQCKYVLHVSAESVPYRSAARAAT